MQSISFTICSLPFDSLTKFLIYSRQNSSLFSVSSHTQLCSLSPYHLINNSGITLNKLDNLCTHVIIRIRRNINCIITVCIHRNREIYCLQNLLRRNAANRKYPLSIASGRSVLVRMETVGNLKYAPSSGTVPLSLTTQNAFC